MNSLELLRKLLSEPVGEGIRIDVPTCGAFLALADAALAIDLREQDVPAGPTRSRIQALHEALAPLVAELVEEVPNA